MAAGVSTRSVSKWLNKDCEMGVGKALRIQRELFPEIEPSYLFRYEPSGK